MNLYDEFYPLAVEMLNEFGTTATLTRAGAVAPTAAQKFNKAARLTSSGSTVTTLAVVGPQTVHDDQGRVVTRSVATMLAQPTEGDTLTMGEQVWAIGEVTALAPQGKAIVYTAVVL